MPVPAFRQVAGREPAVRADQFFPSGPDGFRDPRTADQQLPVPVNPVPDRGEWLPDRTAVADLPAHIQLHGGDADLGHPVAVRDMIPDPVHEFQHARPDLAAAADQEPDAVAEHVLPDLPEENARYEFPESGNAFRRCGDLHSLLVPGPGLFPPVPDGADRLFVCPVPQHRHREDMGHPVAADGLDNRVRLQVFQQHERPGKEREPDIDGHKPENMVKRQKRQLLQLSPVMLFHLRAVPDDLVAVLDHHAECIRGIGAYLNLFRRSGTHQQDLRPGGSLSLRAVPVTFRYRAGRIPGIRCDVLYVDRADRKLLFRVPFAGHHAHRVRILQHRVQDLPAQPQIHQQRTVSAQQDCPERLDPFPAVVHIQADHRSGRAAAQRLPQLRRHADDLLPALAVGDLLDAIAPAAFEHDVVPLRTHQRTQLIKADGSVPVLCLPHFPELFPDKRVDAPGPGDAPAQPAVTLHAFSSLPSR